MVSAPDNDDIHHWRIQVNVCTDSLAGSPSFTIETTKLEDGTFKATCCSNSDIPAQTADTEVEAIRAMMVALHNWAQTGCRQ